MSVPPSTPPTPPNPHTSPVHRFLGAAHAVGGPFALLGVHPDSCVEAIVLEALDRQLVRVGEHPEAETPAADEVRLALHSAAAQLLDPATRTQLIARWRGSRPPSTTDAPRATPAPSIPSPAPMPRTAAPAPRSPLSPPRVLDPVTRRLLERDALVSIGMMGGWNPHALERFAMLAKARGIGVPHVAAVAKELARGGHSRAPAALSQTPTAPSSLSSSGPATKRPPLPVHTPRSRPDDWSTADPGLKILRRAILGGGALLVVAAVSLAMLIMWLGRRPTPPPAPAPTTPTPTIAAKSNEPVIPATDRTHDTSPTKATTDPNPPPTAKENLDTITLDLERAMAAAGTNPSAALERFNSRVRALASGWPDLSRDRLVAANDAVLGFLYRVVDQPVPLSAAVDQIAQLAGPISPANPKPRESAIAPGVWAIAMLNRLSAENDLPAAARTRIFQALADSLGPSRASLEPTFDAGATAAMLALPAWMAPPPPPSGPESTAPTPAHDAGAWRAWITLGASPALADEATRARLLIAGLEHLLLSGSVDASDAGARTTVASIVTALPWRETDESRRWLLRVFEDARFTPADLQAVTSALATASGAPGVDPTMVLSAGADEASRLEMRDRFAQAWNVKDEVDRGKLVQDLQALARSALEREAIAGSPASQLAATIALSRASEAIAWFWKGEREEAVLALTAPTKDLDDLLTSAARESAAPLLGESSGDGDWALRFRNAASNVRQRLEQIDTLARSGRAIGPVDAEALAQEAFAGQSQEVRQRAGDVLLQLSNTPAVVNAVLELMPRLGKNTANARMIEYIAQAPLPSIRDPRWPIQARQVLVERLLEVVAAGSETRVIDLLAAKLRVAYRARSLAKPQGAEDRRMSTGTPAHVSAGAMAQSFRRQADALIPRPHARLSLAQIDERRAARLGIAQGLVETFAVEQLHLCELMAYVVAGEEPARAPRVLEVMDALAESRRSAGDLLAQVRLVEAAILQLWVLRLEGVKT